MRERVRRTVVAMWAVTLIAMGAACADNSKGAVASEARVASTKSGAATTRPTQDANGMAILPPDAGFVHATFAGGCFWSEESVFEGFTGVHAVTSGYTGGQKKNPTYEDVSSEMTGHAESVDVLYDPKKVTYAQLVDLYWHNIDPTQTDGQFCDHGSSYRPAIFYHDASQQAIALASKKAIEASKRFEQPIVTEIVAATQFYPAEEYHQNFAERNKLRYQAYRIGCGRDRRLKEIWGKPGRQGGH